MSLAKIKKGKGEGRGGSPGNEEVVLHYEGRRRALTSHKVPVKSVCLSRADGAELLERLGWKLSDEIENITKLSLIAESQKSTLGGKPISTFRVLADFRKALLVKFGSIQAAFDVFDLNWDRALTLKEWISAISKWGIAGVDLARFLFEFSDLDGNGEVTLSEFNAVMLTQQPLETLSHLRARVSLRFPSTLSAVEHLLTELRRRRGGPVTKALQLPPMEFCPLLKDFSVLDPIEQLIAFKLSDVMEVGKISLDDFTRALQAVSPYLLLEHLPIQLRSMFGTLEKAEKELMAVSRRATNVAHLQAEEKAKMASQVRGLKSSHHRCERLLRVSYGTQAPSSGAVLLRGLNQQAGCERRRDSLIHRKVFQRFLCSAGLSAQQSGFLFDLVDWERNRKMSSKTFFQRMHVASGSPLLENCRRIIIRNFRLLKFYLYRSVENLSDAITLEALEEAAVPLGMRKKDVEELFKLFDPPPALPCFLRGLSMLAPFHAFIELLVLSNQDHFKAGTQGCQHGDQELLSTFFRACRLCYLFRKWVEPAFSEEDGAATRPFDFKEFEHVTLCSSEFPLFLEQAGLAEAAASEDEEEADLVRRFKMMEGAEYPPSPHSTPVARSFGELLMIIDLECRGEVLLKDLHHALLLAMRMWAPERPRVRDSEGLEEQSLKQAPEWREIHESVFLPLRQMRKVIAVNLESPLSAALPLSWLRPLDFGHLKGEELESGAEKKPQIKQLQWKIEKAQALGRDQAAGALSLSEVKLLVAPLEAARSAHSLSVEDYLLSSKLQMHTDSVFSGAENQKLLLRKDAF